MLVGDADLVNQALEAGVAAGGLAKPAAADARADFGIHKDFGLLK